MAACLMLAGLVPLEGQQPMDRGITAVPGLRVGHHTLTGRPTGCTVVLSEAGAVAGVDVRGSAPGTRETDLLSPVNSVSEVHAVVLSGGSAFGLSAADGVMTYLSERNVGYAVGPNRVPIVPAAIIFDLGVGGDPTIRPTSQCGYAAAVAATDRPVAEGNIGVGAGATVGKLAGWTRAMKGGVGSASIVYDDGTVVAALVVVNAVGDVVDPATGRILAGARGEDGNTFLDVRRLIRSGTLRGARNSGENTSLAVVATNARLTKTQATKLAQMAHDGFARSIYPVHTPVDGDVVFALATGQSEVPADLLVLGALAADVVADAVLRAVRAAEGLPGLPAARDVR